jgi:hypothetical protein
MLDGDGMDCSTRVIAASGTWVSTVLSYCARHLKLLPSVGLVLLASPSAESPWVWLMGARVRPHMGYEGGS